MGLEAGETGALTRSLLVGAIWASGMCYAHVAIQALRFLAHQVWKVSIIALSLLTFAMLAKVMRIGHLVGTLRDVFPSPSKNLISRAYI